MLQALTLAPRRRRGNATTSGPAAIPEIFCWTKMGTEAGQPLATILHRKELERSAGGGTFAWGIGNSLGEAADLARQMSPSGDLDVLFTPMKSAPKAADVAPSQLLLWVYYLTRTGRLAALPEHMVVTSRGGPDKRMHYALLCQSDDPLEEGHDFGAFSASGVRNLASMNPVGASQVTSVVRYQGDTTPAERAYRVAFKAKLYAQGFVRLVEPIPMTGELMALYEQTCRTGNEEAWRSGARRLRNAALVLKCGHDQQEMLFA